MLRTLLLICCLSLTVAAQTAQTKTPTPAPTAPPITTANAVLTVNGMVEHELKLKAADLAKLPRHSIKTVDHDGKPVTFDGVALIDILQLAGVKFGESLRGAKLATYLLVTGADGYQVVFALPEFDPAYNNRMIILADKRDDKPLSATEQPYRIVVEGEQRPARWIRQVTTFTIRNAKH